MNPSLAFFNNIGKSEMNIYTYICNEYVQLCKIYIKDIITYILHLYSIIYVKLKQPWEREIGSHLQAEILKLLKEGNQFPVM